MVQTAERLDEITAMLQNAGAALQSGTGTMTPQISSYLNKVIALREEVDRIAMYWVEATNFEWQ